MDGSTRMTMEATKTMANMAKTSEQVASLGQRNVEAIMRSGRVWAAEYQNISKTMAAATQAYLNQTTCAWKALIAARSLREAMELQARLTQTSFEMAVAETGKLRDATIRLTEYTMAPIMQSFAPAVEKSNRPAD
jgi:phasin family protein